MDFLGRGFKAAKCKTLLRLAMSRIKLLRNKRENQVKGMRKEIANLLQTGQEPSARIRIEHIFREQNLMAAYEIVELFCELVVARLPIIESQKQCPLDLKEAVSSLIFAAPRCADLPELLELRGLFVVKYGKEFVASAAELRPDCGVNRRIIEKLSVRAPSGEIKLKLLKEVAAEFNVDWDPSQSEAELLKQHEDLLDGPSQFISSSQRPLAAASTAAQRVPNQRLSEESSEADFPSVPVQNPRPNVPIEKPAKTFTPSFPPQPEVKPDPERQFIPFVVPPVAPAVVTKIPSSPPRTTSSSSESYDEETTGNKDYSDYKDVAAAAQAAAVSAERAAKAARAAASLAKGSSSSFSAAQQQRVRAPPAQQQRVVEDDDSDSDEGVNPVQQTQAAGFGLTNSSSRWKTRDERSSDSEDEEEIDHHSHGAATSKPASMPQYDSEDDADNREWKQRFAAPEFGSAVSQQSPHYDIFDSPKLDEAPSKRPSFPSYDVFDSPKLAEASPPKRQSFPSYDVFDSPKLDEAPPPKRPSFPSYDISPSASLPQFDEPDAAADDEPIQQPEKKSFKWQSSFPPQRAPPEVPKPSVSRTDSTGSNSSGGGPSVHPKLPDYDDLAARFQALKSRR